jgi:hypothetical protein
MSEEGSYLDHTRSVKAERIASWIEAGLWAGLLALGSLLALSVMEPSAQTPPPRQLIEAEELEIVARSGKFNFWLQPTKDFAGGRWSGDGQMFAVRAQRGDWIELALPQLAAPSDAQGYSLTLYLTRAPDYGIVSYHLNGSPLAVQTDLWSERGVLPTGPVDLGRVPLREGRNTLRITVNGTNPRSRAPHYQFGFDGLELRAQ